MPVGLTVGVPCDLHLRERSCPSGGGDVMWSSRSNADRWKTAQRPAQETGA